MLIVFPVATFLLWPFFGFSHYVGDHEMGAGWDLFVKSSPSFQLLFTNPAQDGLGPDIVPFDQMDDARKEHMQRYCKIRYWVDDVAECYRILNV